MRKIKPTDVDGYLLVVDDCPAMAELIARPLREHGYRVEIAPTATTALLCTLINFPSLLIIDDHLPDMDGFELWKRLLQYEMDNGGYDKCLNTIMLVDNENPYLLPRVMAYEIRPALVLTKPFNPKMLVYFVDRIVLWWDEDE